MSKERVIWSFDLTGY